MVISAASAQAIGLGHRVFLAGFKGLEFTPWRGHCCPTDFAVHASIHRHVNLGWAFFSLDFLGRSDFLLQKLEVAFMMPAQRKPIQILDQGGVDFNLAVRGRNSECGR